MICALLVREPRYFDLGALFGRIERFEARRRRLAPHASVETPRSLDMALLQEGLAFERAWGEEIAALIADKRSQSMQSLFAARRARAATHRLAARIEMARAHGLAGLKVKARVTLWRRNGEPSTIIGDGAPAGPAH